MTDSTPIPECSGDDNCIECCPEVEVSMPGTIAALTAELTQTKDERDALLHVRHTLTAERDDLRRRNAAGAASEIDLARALDAAEAERDRYRDALERIAACRYLGEPTLESTIASTALIARAALTPIEEQT